MTPGPKDERRAKREAETRAMAGRWLRQLVKFAAPRLLFLVLAGVIVVLFLYGLHEILKHSGY